MRPIQDAVPDNHLEPGAFSHRDASWTRLSLAKDGCPSARTTVVLAKPSGDWGFRHASGGVVNKLAVRQVEMGYSLGEPSLGVRLHLESGQATEQKLPQGTDE